MGVFKGGDRVRERVVPHPIYPEASPYRVRLPGSIAAALGWPRDHDSFNCHGVFRTDGELLCAAASVVSTSGHHPFEAALRFRESREIHHPYPTVAIEDLPSIETLSLELQIFDFEAKWTNERRSQLDLQIGTARTSLLGWKRHGDKALYAVSVGGVLCLFSEEKIRAIQRSGWTEFDES